MYVNIYKNVQIQKLHSNNRYLIDHKLLITKNNNKINRLFE